MSDETFTNAVPCTTVDLNLKQWAKNPAEQLVYASSLYGTLFAVYATFDTEESGDERILKLMHLRLYNYKGFVNIGFIGDPKFDYDTNRLDF